MSTRKSAGLRRATLGGTVADSMMLQMRLFREMLAAQEGTIDSWHELAGIVNVCGVYAHQRRRPDLLKTISAMADALRSIDSRNARVGGRWASTPDETDAITAGLNVIDIEILPRMLLTDFVRIAKQMNTLAKSSK